MHLIENFKQETNPDINHFPNEYHVLCKIVYHMNGTLKFKKVVTILFEKNFCTYSL